MPWQSVIGLEVHAQLKTKTKIFCGCPTDFGMQPNEQICPVCIGMPGVLPVLNREAVELAIRTGLALNCEIAADCRFDRKNYFYADLPKGYQISQFELPICKEGHLDITGKTVRIQRAHLEEDAGKLVHAGAAGLHGSEYSLADYNRSSMPLLEIVSQPDIETPEQAREYLTNLRNILRYVETCDGNLEEGSFRCDANVSIRPVGETKLGTRTEIKNMNSFKAVQRAIQSEIERQIALVESGGAVVQETRLWDENSGKTFTMRSKEDAHDYRYFPEPDLMPLQIDREWVERVRQTLPELPNARRDRYVSQYGLPAESAAILSETREMAEYFESTLKAGAESAVAEAAKYLVGPITAYLNDKKLELSQIAMTPEHFAALIVAEKSGTIGSTTSKQLLPELLEKGGDPAVIIKERNLAQISDPAVIRGWIDDVFARSQSQLEDYKNGKVKLRQYFVGELMKLAKGKANTQVMNQLLDEMLPTPQ